jgi:dTDP-glucose 4,6-dehydratase
MNVLITGGAGFIGSNLVHYLAKERPAWKLYVLDLLTYAGNLENISALLESGKAEVIRTNIVDASRIGEVFEERKFDLVFHLAAESHVDRSIHSASEFVLTNVVGTQNLINSAHATKVRTFVHISTDEVYGSALPGERFHETTPLDPTSPYAASKAASDLMALAFHKTHGFDVRVTRCTNNYGPYQFPEKFIPLFITNALDEKELPLYGDGMNERSWIYVEDHCAALLKVAEKGKAGEVYNIGGEKDAELPNKVVTERILTQLGKPQSLVRLVNDRLAHDRRYAVDCSKIARELGWKTETQFTKGLKKTVDWYIANRNWWERIKSGEYQEFYKKNYGNR